ncbi:MAG: SdpI family protein [Flavobacteriia bacterium]|nr:SdpI family protein [Flavobacteriia bacterium]MBH2023323.1 SdpI family protein [Flavobacteriales bacterium]
MLNQLFEDPFFNITALVGGIFVAAGFFMLKSPPKKINFLYGYRTNSSMKNQKRWEFAQKYSAKEMMITGLVLAASGLITLITDFATCVKLGVGLAMIGLAVIVLLVRVERAIKKRFSE